MERALLFSNRRWNLLLFGFALFLAVFAIGTERTTAQTNICDSISISPRGGDSCCFNFLVENSQRSRLINRVRMDLVEGGVFTGVGGPQGSSPNYSGTTAVWSFPNGLPSRSDGMRACFGSVLGAPTKSSFTVLVRWMVDSSHVVCMDTLTLQCSDTPDSTGPCLSVIEQEIQCRPELANPQNVWSWNFNIKNLSRFYARTYQMTVLSPSGITISPANYQHVPGIPSGSAFPRHNATITGGQPGQTVRILIRMCGSSTPNTDDVICCEQIIEIRLPECPAATGCVELVEQEVGCDSTGYIWCFNIRNKANWTMGSVAIYPAGNVAVTPSQFKMSTPVQPGGLSSRICVHLTGAKPGRMMFIVQNCADRLDVCCYDTIEIELPECEPVHRDCCDGFIITLGNTQPVAAPNGLTGLIGLIGAGPNPIAKASAVIVSASVNGQPAFAYFNSGTILNPLGAGTVTPPLYGQELIWNSAAGVPMTAPSLFLNWLRLPPMAPNARRDTVTFCIRWRFTDINCRSCDTLVCYRVVRNQFFFNTGNNARRDDEKNNAILGGNGSISGNLKGQNAATLSISFPELPADEFGQVTFKGLRIQADQNVRINGVTSDNPMANFSIDHGIASGSFSAMPGDQITMNLTYDNLNARTALDHFLLISYESSLLPGVEQQMPVSVTLRQEGVATGGDQVEAVRVEVPSKERVETFALHLRNSNTTSEHLSGLHIVAGDGVKLLAVGPTSSETEALLRFGAEGEGGRPYVSEAAEGTVALTPGSERNPIYITVSINEEADPIITYSTLNGLDGVVSQGELNLAQISSTEEEGGVTGTSISLGQSVPNPTTGDVAISLHLAKTERVTLVVRDANGREVLRLLENEQMSSGTHVVAGNVAELPSGTYFYTLETPAGHETRKMTIAR